MAEVDFSNARIEPASSYMSLSLRNPTVIANVALSYNNALYNASGTAITSSFNRTQLINQQKQLMYLYQGTFSTSGTEFYIVGSDDSLAAWKVSNISFQAGDTFIFQINATLTCN